MFKLAEILGFGSVILAVIISIIAIWFEELIPWPILEKSYGTLGVLFVGAVICAILSIGFRKRGVEVK